MKFPHWMAVSKTGANETDGVVKRRFCHGHSVRDRIAVTDAALSLAGFQGTSENRAVSTPVFKDANLFLQLPEGVFGRVFDKVCASHLAM